jgi:hypothetical protein
MERGKRNDLVHYIVRKKSKNLKYYNVNSQADIIIIAF